MKKVVLTVFKGKLLIKRQFPEAMIGNTMGLLHASFLGQPEIQYYRYQASPAGSRALAVHFMFAVIRRVCPALVRYNFVEASFFFLCENGPFFLIFNAENTVSNSFFRERLK